MNGFFKRIVAFIPVLICTLAFVACYWSLTNSSSTDARVDRILSILKNTQYGNGDLLRKLETMEYQQDYASDQIGRQSDMIIAYVTILFAILALVGWGIFEAQLTQLRENYLEGLNLQKKRIDEIEKNNYTLHESIRKLFDALQKKLESDYAELKLENNATLYMHLNNIISANLEDRDHAEAFINQLRAINVLAMALPYLSADKKEERIQKIFDQLEIYRQRLEVLLLAPPTLPYLSTLAKNFDYEEGMNLLNPLFKVEGKGMIETLAEIRLQFKQIKEFKESLPDQIKNAPQ